MSEDLYGGDKLYEFVDKHRHGTSSVSGTTIHLKRIVEEMIAKERAGIVKWLRSLEELEHPHNLADEIEDMGKNR